MADKKGASFATTILKLLMVVPTIFGFVGYLSTVVMSEARLAKQQVVTLIIYCLILLVLLISAWMCILGIVLLALLAIPLTGIQALLILCFINIFFLILFSFLIRLLNNQLFFPITSELLKNFKQLTKD